MPPAFFVGLGLSATAAAVATTVIATTLINIALTKLEQLFIRKPSAGAPPPINLTVQATTEFRRLIFGTVRAGGVVVFYRTAGTNNEFLWYVVAYAGHQCSALGDAYLDARRVPSSDINGSTGAVATATFNSKLAIWSYLGGSTQTQESHLASAFASTWTSDHTLQGICYRVFRLTRDDKAWPNGAPQNFSSIVSGALLYDPRKDSTNGGSGSHRRTDPATWEFSRNAALIVRWYLSGGAVANDVSNTRLVKYGLRESDSRIDDAYVITAANHCSEVLTGPNSPPGGDEKRYYCDIEVTCGQTKRDVLTELLSTMGPGQLVYVHGMWRLYAAAYDSPVHDFDQDDLHGEMEVQDTNSAQDRYNAVCGSYIDASQGYQAATTIFRTQSSYETQDGGQRIEKTLPLRGVTSPYQAQRICERVNRASRYMRTCKFRFRRRGMVIANWETFTFSHSRYGWVDRVFRCIERELDIQDDGAVLMVITAKQEDPAIYTDLQSGDYVTGTSITNAIQQDTPEAPTSLTTTSRAGQTLQFDWSLGSFWELNGISEIWEYTAASPFSSATKVWQGRGTTAIITKSDTTTRYYWVRVRTMGGQVSGTYPSGNGVAGAAGLVDTSMIANLAVSQTVTDIGTAQSTTVTTVNNTPQTFTTSDVCSVSITTQGGPVGIRVTSPFHVGVSGNIGVVNWVKMLIKRDGSALPSAAGQYYDNSGIVTDNPQALAIIAVDSPSAGSHTYTFVGQINGYTGLFTPPPGAVFLHVGDFTGTTPPIMEVREYKK